MGELYGNGASKISNSLALAFDYIGGKPFNVRLLIHSAERIVSYAGGLIQREQNGFVEGETVDERCHSESEIGPRLGHYLSEARLLHKIVVQCEAETNRQVFSHQTRRLPNPAGGPYRRFPLPWSVEETDAVSS